MCSLFYKFSLSKEELSSKFSKIKKISFNKNETSVWKQICFNNIKIEMLFHTNVLLLYLFSSVSFVL